MKQQKGERDRQKKLRGVTMQLPKSKHPATRTGGKP
jgi:hypothetical protein